MSERREHRRRYNKRLEFIAKFESWLKCEPPTLLFWKWKRWLKERPTFEEIYNEIDA